MTWKRKQRMDAMNYQTRAEKCAFEVGYYDGFQDDVTMTVQPNGWPEVKANIAGWRCGFYDKVNPNGEW